MEVYKQWVHKKDITLGEFFSINWWAWSSQVPNSFPPTPNSCSIHCVSVNKWTNPCSPGTVVWEGAN